MTVPDPAATASADSIAHPDVLVIGGGPAGSTIATLLARKGWQVTMLEKDRHPRFHIGESLLPMNMPILERLGVLEQVRGIGVLKLGADFPVDDGSYNGFPFKRALGDSPGYAFHVKRAEFDQLLFEHARGEGVDARDNVRVERVELDDGATLVHARGEHGTLRFRPRYLVDASGRDAFLGGRLGLKRRNPRHASAALFSHYTGVERRPGDDAGNVSIIRHEHGWLWLIPLRDGVTSVGAVCTPEYLKQRRGDSEAFLQQTLESVPAAAERMRGAKRVAPVHATGNYAYDCSRMSGPGWMLLGDAWTFVDPMFSSGVFLAMNSAELGAGAVDTLLREPAREAALMAALEKRLSRGLDELKWFIYRFTSPTMKSLFSRPRNVLQVEQAVISMLAGDVFDAPAVRWRLRLFRLIYAFGTLKTAPQAWRAWRERKRQPAVAFGGDTLQADPPAAPRAGTGTRGFEPGDAEAVR
ncbi:NAD(P)/FAD-dependent oxidoreductase [Novilysobacter arseniciresistens]|uniref:NAD(P)/FAD-dependent oxidoreductase n=1 Tax=Novilysobacter arseniciresistens TaxID=1385522 RepID=UPI0009DDE488|nr:NAD(P)/FAD-dependent oxidoreductase [Lysobacter arseniciresistens]